MRFLVEIIGTNGQRGWVLSPPADTLEQAKQLVQASRSDILGIGLGFEATRAGVREAQLKSNSFVQSFQGKQFEEIASELGFGDAAATTTPSADPGAPPVGLPPRPAAATPATAAPVPLGATAGGAAPLPTDPFSSETGDRGFGVAFRRALDQAGLGSLRGVGRDLQAPLSNIFDIGGLAGLTEGPFAGLGAPGREDFAAGDFINSALSGLRGGGSTIGQLAGSALGSTVNPQTERFFNPQFGIEGGLRDAEEAAQLARLDARQRFGTVLARRLTGPQQLVEQFRAQPTGGAITDFREFLAGQLGR